MKADRSIIQLYTLRPKKSQNGLFLRKEENMRGWRKINKNFVYRNFCLHIIWTDAELCRLYCFILKFGKPGYIKMKFTNFEITFPSSGQFWCGRKNTILKLYTSWGFFSQMATAYVAYICFLHLVGTEGSSFWYFISHPYGGGSCTGECNVNCVQTIISVEQWQQAPLYY